MTTSATVINFKKQLLQDIVSSDAVIAAMGNDDIEENDEAIYKYVFPYFYIPDTIESAHSYICIKVNMTGLSNANDLFGNFTVAIWVIVNQEIMQMDGVGGATRLDYLASMVEKLFSGSELFGMKRLRISKNIEDDMDHRHRARLLTFTTTDVSESMECD